MKHYLYLLILLTVLCSCSNRRSINILISNPTTQTVRQHQVELSVGEVERLLDVQSVEKLVLLNEKNIAVDYTIDTASGKLLFTVPNIMAQSQKQFTLSTAEPTLWDNLFSFRHENIQVSVGKDSSKR